jgi:uncharacterized protein YecT (DUF1311 family)
MRQILPFVTVGFLVLALASWPGSVRAASPSFDCKRAVAVVEKEICADPLVATQDTQLAAAFKAAMTRRSPAERLILLDNQRRWLKERDCSHNPDTHFCLSYLYDEQLDWVQSGGDFEPLAADGCLRPEGGPGALECVRSSANGFAEIAETLKHYKPDDTLVSCSRLLEITLTKYETGFGGVCRLRETKTRKYFQGLVCGDTGVGNFRLIPTGRAVASKTDLAHFIADNCAGG